MENKTYSKYYIDENVTRLVALQVVIILLISLIIKQGYLIYFLTIDFAIRAFTFWPSPLGLLAKAAAKIFNLKPKPIFAAPKKFAALVGFLFTAAISTFILTSAVSIVYILGAILLLFAFLEAAFGVCAGCYVYNWVVAPLLNRK